MSTEKTGDLPKTVLLRHQGSEFDKDVISRWLADGTDMVAELVIEPDYRRKLGTLRHEYQRNGPVGLLDALTFHLYYRYRLSGSEHEKIRSLTDDIGGRYPDHQVETYSIKDPNSKRTVSLLHKLDPDLMLARCRILLDERVFSTPEHGTFVLHPGICPEYRNQHGCFWALANGDDTKVGYSLLRIDEGIDTGEIYAQNGTAFNPKEDEHIYIQLKTVAENLGEVGDVLRSVHRGTAAPVDTTGRKSAVWGMPKLSAWATWKRRVHKFDIDHVNSSVN
ncbi:formyltransferase family protein [Haloarchaeobius salinus]|uniref:formyltransferase family protein n=1 Tax=Haloarchaeobius salinus TaxID=1198298 RepID=UPI00210D7C5F|nr:formyltransferase family protein [Haloarchaeobius salinus]